MEKIKRIFVGAVMCMMFMLSSSDVVAQAFVDGATATTNLNQELPAIESAYDALDQNSPTFSDDAKALKLRYSTVEEMLRYISASNSSTDVEALLLDLIVLRSEAYVPIDLVKYDQGDYGSTEIANLKSYLQGVLTN